MILTRRHNRRDFNELTVKITATNIGHISIKTIDRRVNRNNSIDDDDGHHK